MSEEERDFYDCTFNKKKTQFDKFVSSGTVLSNFTHVFEMILRLRQICDHPYLIYARSDVKHIDKLEITLRNFFKSRLKSYSKSKLS